MYNKTWELVIGRDSGGQLYRCEVPGGWLYKQDYPTALEFVPVDGIEAARNEAFETMYGQAIEENALRSWAKTHGHTYPFNAKLFDPDVEVAPGTDWRDEIPNTKGDRWSVSAEMREKGHRENP